MRARIIFKCESWAASCEIVFCSLFFFIYLTSACFVGAEQKITAQRGGATGVRSEKRLASAHTTLVLTQFPCYYFRPRRIDLSIEHRRRRDNFDRPKNLMPLWLAEAKMVIFLLSEWQIWTMNHSNIYCCCAHRACLPLYLMVFTELAHFVMYRLRIRKSIL